MTYEVHEPIRRTLMDALCEDPPPGYSSASMAQLERADKFLFAKLGEYTRAGLRGAILSGLPLDGYIARVLESKFNMLLMPLAEASGSAASSSSHQNPEHPPRRAAKPDRQAATIDNLRKQVENLKRKQDNPGGGGGKRQREARVRTSKYQDRAGPCRQS